MHLFQIMTKSGLEKSSFSTAKKREDSSFWEGTIRGFFFIDVCMSELFGVSSVLSEILFTILDFGQYLHFIQEPWAQALTKCISSRNSQFGSLVCSMTHILHELVMLQVLTNEQIVSLLDDPVIFEQFTDKRSYDPIDFIDMVYTYFNLDVDLCPNVVVMKAYNVSGGFLRAGEVLSSSTFGRTRSPPRTIFLMYIPPSSDTGTLFHYVLLKCSDADQQLMRSNSHFANNLNHLPPKVLLSVA